MPSAEMRARRPHSGMRASRPPPTFPFPSYHKKMSRKFKKLPTEPGEAVIENLSHDGRGVAHIEGKTVFVAGALPGERVRFRYTRRLGRHDEGDTVEVLEASPQRVAPGCPHFGVCGGCSLQHLAHPAQLELKQRTLLEQLQHIGGIAPETVLPPLSGPIWGYRRRARMGVKYVIKKDSLLVGFREKSSGFLAELQRCEVLQAEVGQRIGQLREVLGRLAGRDHIAQLEMAGGDAATALVLRNLQTLDEADLVKLREFAQSTGLHLYLQPGGLDSITPLWPIPAQPLHYLLEDDLALEFGPSDFVQVNAEMNRKMLAQAMSLLAPQAHERVLELFCGLGNFTLPLARRAGEVTAVEGDAALIARARANALRLGLRNIEYDTANLAESGLNRPWLTGRFDKLLLDPPRTGAQEILQQLSFKGVERILYVSCNPATLARDAGELVRKHGFRLAAAGIMDMFPHTAHVESIALLRAR